LWTICILSPNTTIIISHEYGNSSTPGRREQSVLRLDDRENSFETFRRAEKRFDEFAWDETELGVIFITPTTKPARPFFWRKHRDSGIATGMLSTKRRTIHSGLPVQAAKNIAVP
jgi:hypothetical protein